MLWIVKNLWLIPALPLLAAGITALAGQSRRRFAASLAIGSMILSFLLSLCAIAATLTTPAQDGVWRKWFNFNWLQMGDTSLQLGWVLDPLTAVMVVMVTFVGALIFIYSVGYMAHDKNFTRFFCFLALFAAAMLGLVIANNLLLLFMSWELVGLASYLLIGFWYHKPSAAAAAKKAFIVTRIGDIGFFLGMLWLYAQTGTLLFYDDGAGCLEQSALTGMVTKTIAGGMLLSTVISLLIFCGAMGKSGQFPLHVWLPDAMEGPTPVSALIHAATMVAAGVFLVARMYPLMSAHPVGVPEETTALGVVTWIGAITAVFAALIAVAQTDIKRILAYSTVSQLGYMMLGIGVGGPAVGMFHLITHAFFKALLFMGAGSVIHGCHDEQDIRRMGGLRSMMPITFATYAIGMMALCGVPFFFSGFWSKDEILHTAMGWPVSKWPFYLAAFGALMTAFYMTRQMFYVFFGAYRGQSEKPTSTEANSDADHHSKEPHESPSIMTLPLVVLAAFAMLLGIVGTPFWPWFHDYMTGQLDHLHFTFKIGSGVILTMLKSIIIVVAGIGLGWWVYGSTADACRSEVDPLDKLQPDLFTLLRRKFYVDEFYSMTVIKANAALARMFDWFDRYIWNGMVFACAYLVMGLSWVNQAIDEFVVNLGFDRGCTSVRQSGWFFSKWQNGQIQRYLRVIGLALAIFGLVFIWGCRA